MPIHQRRLKVITFSLGAEDFECQVKSWTFDPGISDGERLYTFCPDGKDVEETDPEPTLELTFFSDWRANGISDFLNQNSGDTVTFQLDHHPDVPAEHVRYSGTLIVKAPPVGGEARATEETSVTLQVIDYVYSRV